MWSKEKPQIKKHHEKNYTPSAFGCATIINGTHEDILISSTPSKARVTIDYRPYGQTPVVANLDRKNQHIVKLSLPGFYDYETIITKHVSGTLAGNILFGGLLGLVIDMTSGAMWTLEPTEIRANLRKNGEKIDAAAQESSQELEAFYLTPTDRLLIDADYMVVWRAALAEIRKVGYENSEVDIASGIIETKEMLEQQAELSKISTASFRDEQVCTQKKTQLSCNIESIGEKTMIIINAKIEGYLDYGGFESGEWMQFKSSKVLETRLLQKIMQNIEK